jgi:hypothetical protein
MPSHVNSSAAFHFPRGLATKRSPIGFQRDYAGTERFVMIPKIFILALALLMSTATTSFAQSQRNYGPNGPATGDTFGEPYSGSAAARRGDDLPYTRYGYRLYWRHPRDRYRHWYH